MKLAFLDTETTGLDPDRHEVWEVGLVVRDVRPEVILTRENEHHWFLPVDLGRADPVALAIGGYHERMTGPGPAVADLRDFAQRFADLTRGAHLVGAVVSFDEERLRKLLRANGACPEWHYHLIDVEALAVGALCARAPRGDAAGPPNWTPPWDSAALSRAVGVDPEQFQKHTAMGDVRWAMAIYDAVTGPGVPPEPLTTPLRPPALVMDAMLQMGWTQGQIGAAMDAARAAS